jgi:organic hydroperoxide reductase OsmC/OhrA
VRETLKSMFYSRATRGNIEVTLTAGGTTIERKAA